jgi:hypothetical protein
MGLAEQLMDEIASTRFPDPASTASLTGSNTLWWPRSRETFDDVDAYAGWNSTPPCDRSGHPVGTEGYQLWGYEIPRLYQMRPNQDLVNRMTRQVTVERVRENGSSGWVVETGASNFRRVTVRVSLTDAQSQTRTLAAISRIFSYVPLTP